MRRQIGALLALAVASAWLATGAAPGIAGAPVPGAGSCPMFPADNVWNTPIASLPVDPHSAAWLASMDASSTNLHPDFGPPFGAQPVPYGIPYTVVTDVTPKVSVSFQYADESDPAPYPFTATTPIEDGQDATGDRHALMVDSSTCTLYELYDARYSASGSTAGSGAIWNLESNALRPAGWTSADAAGLPILPGLVRFDEAKSGAITHAIRFTAATTDKSYLWPARHEAGSASNSNLPPMGARFRLKASFDISGFLPQTQVILRAMQGYGLILADNGSNWYFQGTDDPGWSNTLLDQLKTVPASEFEAVDESSLMIDPNSGQARQPGATAPTSPAPAPVSTTPARPAPVATRAAPTPQLTAAPAPSPSPPAPSPPPSPSPSPSPSPIPSPSPSPPSPTAEAQGPGNRAGTGGMPAAVLLGGLAAVLAASGGARAWVRHRSRRHGH